METPTFAWVINSANMEGGKHYVTIFMLAAVSDERKEPKVMEPEKCDGELLAVGVVRKHVQATISARDHVADVRPREQGICWLLLLFLLGKTNRVK